MVKTLAPRAKEQSDASKAYVLSSDVVSFTDRISSSIALPDASNNWRAVIQFNLKFNC